MYSKGISWIDDCRIPFVDEVGIKISGDKKHLQKWKEKDGRTQRNIDEIENTPYINTKGRFPANLLVSDDMLNDGIVSKSNDHKWMGEDTSPIYGKYENRTRTQVYSDKGSNSRYYDIDKWFNNLIDV
jgi:hypothetical protein